MKNPLRDADELFGEEVGELVELDVKLIDEKKFCKYQRFSDVPPPPSLPYHEYCTYYKGVIDVYLKEIPKAVLEKIKKRTFKNKDLTFMKPCKYYVYGECTEKYIGKGARLFFRNI
jgi:hypothetical protein